jgi:nicotinate-nucleotide pyrophosphorylase (carboxylating)
MIPAVSPHRIACDVACALLEDLGNGDVSAALLPVNQSSGASIITRETCVLAGLAWAQACFKQIDPTIELNWQYQDGEKLDAGATICSLRGPARGLLSGERAALNFLQTLSATATVTARYVAIIAGTRCQILDTRKTIPGLRAAQKYAVLCGGGTNHRMGLYDAFLLKENHIHAAGSIAAAVSRARELRSDLLLEVEVETLAQLQECIGLEVPRVLLDNFNLEQMREAVAVACGKIQLEASGGIDEARLREVAETGVDFISIGALTKHVRAVDLSMRFFATPIGRAK